MTTMNQNPNEPLAIDPPLYEYSWDFDYGLGPWTTWLAPSVVTEPGGTVEQFTRLQAPGPLDYNHIDGVGAIWLVAHLSTPTLGSPGVLNLHDAEFQMTVRGTDFDINGGQLVLWATRYVPETGVTEGFYFGLQVTNWANTGSDMAGQITDDWVTITLQISDDPADWTYAGNQESLEGDWADRYVPFDLGQTLSAIDATLHLVVLNADPDAAPTGFLDLSNITVRTQTPAVPDGLAGSNPEVHYGLEDQVATGMLAGDPAVNMAEAVFSLVGGSAVNGVAVIDPDTGAFSFTPPADYFGPTDSAGYATFQYTVSDGTVTSEPITVVVYVGGINDAPVISSRAESVEIVGGQPFAHTLFSGSDIDMNRLGFEIVGGSVVGGTVDLDAHTGRYTFTPTAGFSGAASFRYRVNDGQLDSAEKQVDLTVLPGGQQPAALTFDDAEALLNAGDFDGWTHAVVRLADAGDANAGYHYGTWLADGINGIARDKAMARHYLELAENIVPDANLQLATLYSSGEGGTRDYARARELLEALPENRTAIYRLATLDDLGLGAPQDRQRAVEGYIEAARLGSAEAAYTLGRRYLLGEGVTASAEDAYFWLGLGLKFNAAPGIPIFLDLLTLNMGTAAESLTSQRIADLDAAILAWDAGEATLVNDAPLLGGADTVGGQAIPGATVSGTLARGSDPDGDRPTFILVPDTVENGSLVLDPDTGAFIFTPTAGFTGTGSFDYRVTDGQANSTVRSVSFAIEAGTAAVSDLGGTDEDAAVSVGVAAGLLVNDFAAPSGGLIAVSAVDGVAGNVGAAVVGDWGSLTVQADGSWLYTPAAGTRTLLEGQVVTDAFTYTITDQSGRSSTSTLVVTINGRDGTVLNGSGVLIGSAFGDEITGGLGSDVLLGLAGNDTLVGGAGTANELYGGTGDDTFVISAVGDTIVEAAGEGFDTVQTTLSAYTLRNEVEALTFIGSGGFTGTGSAQANTLTGGAGDDILAGRGGIDQLFGGAGTDTASYAAAAGGVDVRLNGSASARNDGDGATDVLTGIENLTGSAFDDLLVGDDGANVLSGGLGRDTLLGLGGNDRLIGGSGVANQMQGGQGDDTYVLTVFDTVVELVGEGTDTVETTLAAYTLGTHVENLTYLGTGAFTGTGNASANTLTGGAGNDTLDGGTGTDTLIGGRGDDTYRVTDAAAVVVEVDGEGTDLIRTTLNVLGLGAGVENLTFEGTGGFAGTGNALANVITGGAGNDTLDGGAGADRLIGGRGDDTYRVTDAAAVVVEVDGEGTDLIRTTLNVLGLVANVENLTFDGTGGFTGIGNGLANVITGGTSRDVLLGLAGNDTLVGGAGTANELYGGIGDDTYVISVAGDTIVEVAGEGFDTVQTTLSAYTLRNEVEAVTFTGSGAFTGGGSAQDNTLTGGDGDDTLAGHGGIDRLVGGSGTDTASYAAAAGGVDVRLNGSAAARNDGDGATDVLISIENLTGSAFDDLLVGDGTANVLSGGLGRDTLLGLGGNDILIGGTGVANQMQGGQGDDTYVLTASDTCVEFVGEGIDTVEARIGSYTMGNNIENLIYTGPGSFVGNGNALDNVITGGAKNDILRGKGGNDTINGGAGNGDEVQFVGTKAQYTVTVEGAGYRIVDSVADRDGSTFVTSVESLRFLTGNTTTVLSYPPPAPGALEPTDKAVAEDFDGPLVSPLVFDTPGLGAEVMPLADHDFLPLAEVGGPGGLPSEFGPGRLDDDLLPGRSEVTGLSGLLQMDGLINPLVIDGPDGPRILRDRIGDHDDLTGLYNWS